jgi:hypothetical protein
LVWLARPNIQLNLLRLQCHICHPNMAMLSNSKY